MSGNSLFFFALCFIYIVACNGSEGSTEGVRVSPFAHTLKVKPSEMYVKRHATPSMIYSQTGQSEHWD